MWSRRECLLWSLRQGVGPVRSTNAVQAEWSVPLLVVVEDDGKSQSPGRNCADHSTLVELPLADHCPEYNQDLSSLAWVPSSVAPVSGLIAEDKDALHEPLVPVAHATS